MRSSTTPQPSAGTSGGNRDAPPMSVANAKRALYLGADTNLQAAYEIENMNWTEVMQSDEAKVALKTFLDVDPASRRDWFESANSKNYPAYSGH